jgi:DNA-3-methyladenine glycosylase I
MSEKFRCFGNTPLYTDCHDNAWRRPVHDDTKLFEMLIPEGAQARLSWETVLKKREAYREAFNGFDPRKVALYDDAKIAELMTNAGIIRNRLKINAAAVNAKLFIKIIEKHGSFDKFVRAYVDGKPIVGHWASFEDMPIPKRKTPRALRHGELRTPHEACQACISEKRRKSEDGRENIDISTFTIAKNKLIFLKFPIDKPIEGML